jgi:ribosomal protein S14
MNRGEASFPHLKQPQDLRNPVSLVGVKNRCVECGETGFLSALRLS